MFAGGQNTRLRGLHGALGRRELGCEMVELFAAYRAGARASVSDRKKAKAVNFGFLYGMGDDSFRKYCFAEYEIEVSAEDAVAFRLAWYATFPEFKFWHDVTKQARKNNRWTVRTLSGRALTAKTLTAAYNYAGQASCVDICARAFRLFEETPSNIAKYVVGFKFDEFTFEVPEFAAGKLRPVVELCMQQAAMDFLEPYEIPVGEIGFTVQKREGYA